MSLSSPGGRGRKAGSTERPAVLFVDAAEWSAWLAENHDTATELWMLLHKKHVQHQGMVWHDAVVEALRWGWIDSQVQRVDDDTVRQRWTPRRPGSRWSGVNLDTVQQLIAQGRMMPSGLAVYEQRRAERERGYSHDQPHQTLPPEYLALLDDCAAAQAFWSKASAGYRRVATHWVVSAAKDETRLRRMQTLVDDCAQGQLIKPERYGTVPAWVVKARIELGFESS